MKPRHPDRALSIWCLLAGTLLLAPGWAQGTTRVSVNAAGVQGNRSSIYAAISADGRYVAFDSDATNLVPDDTNRAEDVFVHDRLTGQTTRVSVDSPGVRRDLGGSRAHISADGGFVVFDGYATNLVLNNTNPARQVFVHDRQTGLTTCVSVDSAGIQGRKDSWKARVSADGRYVAFESQAPNLVQGDTNRTWDVFVHDRLTGQTTRVSVDSAGHQVSSPSMTPTISDDGRLVAFSSAASSLVPGDTNGREDVFVHDLLTGQTTRVSVDSAGLQGNGYSTTPAISADGRCVAFSSYATNLVLGDTNGYHDVFVNDRLTGQTTRVSVDSAGIESNGRSGDYPALSSNGRHIAFKSDATNLVPGDTNGREDVFVHDRLTGQTARVNVDSRGTEANSWGFDHSAGPEISVDGRYVAFESYADNLVPGDTNGFKDVFVHDREAGSTLMGAGTCPGTMTFTAYGLPAGATVAFIWGTSGSYIIPPGSPCAGTELDLVPLLAPPPGYLLDVASQSGVASVIYTVPAGACGQLLVQVLDVASCLASNTTPL